MSYQDPNQASFGAPQQGQQPGWGQQSQPQGTWGQPGASGQDLGTELGSSAGADTAAAELPERAGLRAAGPAGPPQDGVAGQPQYGQAGLLAADRLRLGRLRGGLSDEGSRTARWPRGRCGWASSAAGAHQPGHLDPRDQRDRSGQEAGPQQGDHRPDPHLRMGRDLDRPDPRDHQPRQGRDRRRQHRPDPTLPSDRGRLVDRRRLQATGANSDSGCQAAQTAFNTYQSTSGQQLERHHRHGDAGQLAGDGGRAEPAAGSQLKALGNDFLVLSNSNTPASMVSDMQAVNSACGMTFTSPHPLSRRVRPAV